MLSSPRKREPRSMPFEASPSGVSARSFQHLQALGSRLRGNDKFFISREETSVYAVKSVSGLLSERVRWVDAEHGEAAGEELNFFQRQANVALFGMAFDVGVELRRLERAAELIAFEFRHVHAVGGKAAERLVESG